MKAATAGTVALLVTYKGQEPCLVETLSDGQEIELIEVALQRGVSNPVPMLKELREQREYEDEKFADYVEGILSQPFLKPEVREQAMEWFKSRMKIEFYQKNEFEATQVIAQYALGLFKENPKRTDFILAGPKAQVDVRIYLIDAQENEPAASGSHVA